MRLISHALHHPTVRVEANENSIVLDGVLRDPDVSAWLCPLIDEIHLKAMEFKVKEIVFDLRRVEYANASAWKCLVYWIKKLRDDKLADYTLRIICNRSHRWQDLGVTFLNAFAGEQLVIEAQNENGKTV